MKPAYIIILLLIGIGTTDLCAQAVDAPVRFMRDTGASDIRVADMDGDGKKDIIATNPALHILMVLRNTSTKGTIDSQSFARPVIYATGTQPGIAAIDDIDGDGKPDLVLLNVGYAGTFNTNNSLTIFHNTSKPGTIQLSAIAIIESTATKPAVYTFRLKPGDHVVRMSDLDKDGKPDIAVLNTAGFISIYHNTYAAGQSLKTILGTPIIIPVEHYPTSYTIGDMDGDTKPDIVTTNYDSSSITVLHNTCTNGIITASSFQPVDFPLGYHPITTSLSDMDGDGKLDAVISNRNIDFTTIIHNTSTPGNYSGTVINMPKMIVASNYYDDIVIQDMNEDGKADLLSLTASLDSVYLYTNKSITGQSATDFFNKKINCPLITIPDCISDLDGDDKPDMIVASCFGIDIYHGKPVPVQQLLSQPLISKVSDKDRNIYSEGVAVAGK